MGGNWGNQQDEMHARRPWWFTLRGIVLYLTNGRSCGPWHQWKWNGRKRTYADSPMPFFPMTCEVCGQQFETTRPERYVREVRR